MQWQRHAIIQLVALALLLSLLPDIARAQRDFQQPIGETVFDRDSVHYRFESFVHASADGTRRWRIRLAVPRQVDPRQARPAIWMLDGNAALMHFDDTLLGQLAARNAPLLVFIGYDNDMRIDTAQRWRDYTPTMTPPGQPRRHLDGGADAFLDIIERGIRPEVARRAVLDPDSQLLWGHSLGGLFVLHTLTHRTGLFRHYVAASPSLWWDEGSILDDVERFVAHNAGQPARLWIMRGRDERGDRRQRRDATDPRAAAYLAMLSRVGPDAEAHLAARLATAPGLDVHHRVFDGLGHGPMFRASLMATLEAFSGVEIEPAPTPSSSDDSEIRERR